MSEPIRLPADRHRESAGAISFTTALDMARTACLLRLEDPLIRYFGATSTGRDVAEASDALASALSARGIRSGHRVALYMQNIPQLPVAIIAIWKLGAIAVPINPMLKEREIELLLTDSGASALLAQDDLYEGVARAVVPRTAVKTVVTCSPLDYLDSVPPLLAGVERLHPDGTEDFAALVAAHAGEHPAPVAVRPDDVAFVVYTSGTTGPPKGALNLHRNVTFASAIWRDWVELGEHDVNLVLAPMFHITGLIAGFGVSLAAPATIVLGYRFDPEGTLAAIASERPTFTVAAITAYQALMRAPGFADADLSCLRAAYTGGAPVAPAVAAAWREASGVPVHNAYGMTETTSPLTLTPLGTEGPVDPASGALSVGIPVHQSHVEVLGDDGQPLAAGEIGELVASGPQVIPGYWEKPEETRTALPDGRLRTGDVGYVDDQGWVFLVDRRKDLIIASGYKVWPREVEDVLYAHPAVREAAVVGIPDSYRGETVKAVVSLRPGASAEPDELIAWCRERLAAYKYPRVVEIAGELPKNPAGKILRRELRGAAGG